MATYAESAASFAHRAKEIQLQQEAIDALKAQDIRNFNQLAFAVCGQPGQVDQQRFADLIDAVFPTGASLGVQASLRQLAYESLTVAVAAIKQRIEGAEEGTSRKLPAHERDERMRRQARRVTGLQIKGDYEPAHSVVDAFVGMLEESVLKVLPLSRCISRDQELAQAKADKQVVVLENHQLQVKPTPKTLTGEASLSNELRVHNAMVRRGLAMDQAGLMTFTVHDKIMREFLGHLTRPHPPGFKGPDIQAVLRADQELWVRCADECKSNLKVGADGRLPLDVAAENLYQSSTVIFNLLPLPGSRSTKRSRSASQSSGQKSVKKKKKKKQPNPKKDGNRSKLPESLKGFSGVNKQKQRICYNYNLPHGCTLEAASDGHGGQKCQRGLHQCIRCHKQHPLHSCDKN